MAAALTDTAGCWLASWLELGGNSLNPGVERAVFIQIGVQFGTNSSFGLGEWL